MAILIIREKGEFDRVLAQHFFEIINLPLIETKRLDDLRDFESKLEKIENYDGVFLTSRNAAEVFRTKLRATGNFFRGGVYVLGKRSFHILETENLNLFFDDSVNTAQELLEKIALETLKDKRFLFVCGEKSLRVVPMFLSEIAEIDEAVVYETRQIAIENDKKQFLHNKFKNNEIAAVCFFSPSAAESFIEQFGAEILHQTKIAAIGKTTAEFFERQDVKVAFVSSKATATDFAVELVEYLKEEI